MSPQKMGLLVQTGGVAMLVKAASQAWSMLFCSFGVSSFGIMEKAVRDNSAVVIALNALPVKEGHAGYLRLVRLRPIRGLVFPVAKFTKAFGPFSTKMTWNAWCFSMRLNRFP